jgi:hypothetical protein
MMPIMRTPEDAGPRLEAGTYEMVVVKVREDHIENSPFGTGDVIKFTLRTTDGENTELEAMANDSLTPLSKLTKWLNALGIGATPGVPLDLERAQGRTCLVNVGIEDKGERGMFNKVAEILPPLRTQSARREATAAVATLDDEPSAQDLADAAQVADEPPEHYHPAAAAGEPIVDARSPEQRELDELSKIPF